MFDTLDLSVKARTNIPEMNPLAGTNSYKKNKLSLTNEPVNINGLTLNPLDKLCNDLKSKNMITL